MRIVVTGASGNLGSYLSMSWPIGIMTSSPWSGTTAAVRGKIKIDPIELTDTGGVLQALADADPDVIIHAAAVSSAEEARLNPGPLRRSTSKRPGCSLSGR